MRSDREDWAQQGGETSRSFAAFAHFRDAGSERSLRATAVATGKPLRLVQRWSGRWQWLRRARGWDAYLDERTRRRVADAVVQARVRHAQQLQAKSQSLMLADVEISRRHAAGTFSLAKSSDVQLLDMSVKGAFALPRVQEAERQVLGDDGLPRPMATDEPDDLTAAIAGDVELLSLAAQLVERASEAATKKKT